MATAQALSIKDMKRVARETGLSIDDVQEYIDIDFIESDHEVPDAEELIYHINYQQSLQDMYRESGDDEREFDRLWCEKYVLGDDDMW